jgi:hypothetical protein
MLSTADDEYPYDYMSSTTFYTFLRCRVRVQHQHQRHQPRTSLSIPPDAPAWCRLLLFLARCRFCRQRRRRRRRRRRPLWGSFQKFKKNFVVVNSFVCSFLLYRAFSALAPCGDRPTAPSAAMIQLQMTQWTNVVGRKEKEEEMWKALFLLHRVQLETWHWSTNNFLCSKTLFVLHTQL